MKKIYLSILIVFILISCHSTNKALNSNDINTNISSTSDTIRIANEELEYEVIIIDGGFNTWLLTYAKPRGYYSESFLESRNKLMISEFNNRVLNSNYFNPNLYDMQINYENNIHYGYEVNYLIYNYLIYFQIKNKQRLGPFAPRP